MQEKDFLEYLNQGGTVTGGSDMHNNFFEKFLKCSF